MFKHKSGQSYIVGSLTDRTCWLGQNPGRHDKVLKDSVGGQFGRIQARNFQGSIRSLSSGKPGTIRWDTVQAFSLSEEEGLILWELKGNEMQLYGHTTRR